MFRPVRAEHESKSSIFLILGTLKNTLHVLTFHDGKVSPLEDYSMKWLKWLIPVFALLLFVGWRIKGKIDDASKLQIQQEQRRKAPQSVEMATAAPAMLEQTIESVGTVESPYSVKLSAKTAGTITYLESREGDKVKPGQVLVKIDPSDLVGQVLQQQSSVAESQARLAQASLTQGSNDTSVQAQIYQQRAAVQSAKADYAQVAENYASQVAAADALVSDSDAKIAVAAAQVDSAKADVNSSNANLDNARSRLARMESLFKQQFIAAQDVDDARAAVKVQQANLEVSRKKLEASQASLSSAKAQRQSVAKQRDIVKRKGLADIEAAKAKVTQANASYSVAQANTSQKQAYSENLAALKAGVNTSKAQLAQARAKLSDTLIRSSIDGTVTSRTADPGTLVTPGQAILTVQYLEWLYVSCSVPVEVSSQIAPSQKAIITFDALPGKVFYGKVGEVNPAADPLSRQFSVRVKLDNPQKIIRPGMYARVQFVTGMVNARVTIPREAVTQSTDQSTVIVVDADGVAHKRVVVLGTTNGVLFEIKSGVEPGEKVVTLSYSAIKEGSKVKLNTKGASEAKGKRGAS
jgi:RND family efflux transporter MFP subunit